MYAVTVMFKVKEGKIDRFLPLMKANAESSVREEPGCLQFDVCQDHGQAEEIFLYEIYEDADAFAAHRETKHFKEFDAATAELVAEKIVKTYNSVFHP